MLRLNLFCYIFRSHHTSKMSEEGTSPDIEVLSSCRSDFGSQSNGASQIIQKRSSGQVSGGTGIKRARRGEQLDQSQSSDWEDVVIDIQENIGKLLDDKKRNYEELKENEDNLNSIRQYKAMLKGCISMKRDLQRKMDEDFDASRDDLDKEMKSLCAKRDEVKTKLERFKQVSLFKDETKRTLQRFIEDKVKDLECPVCLEEAGAPIFSCMQMHVICSTCMDKVVGNICPVCRERYGQDRMRHRFAEKISDELGQMRKELQELEG